SSSRYTPWEPHSSRSPAVITSATASACGAARRCRSRMSRARLRTSSKVSRVALSILSPAPFRPARLPCGWRCFAVLLRGYPALRAFLQEVQREIADPQDHVVESPQVEPLREAALRAGAEFADLQLTDLVGKRLPGPGDVPLQLGL